ncbi:hypothetical protein SAMN04487905_103281 [Actinopolyspora xinjiangensis]|uniref:Uncharacterized protein n=1 Tax=Actinopolyspora xinjiangensis TaxID=405564 RepID=A0A1H0RXQ6_9ACTN|nr:hypothetical protein SAMN04487905_103281 [Actinopolyspora xinjiangensis]
MDLSAATVVGASVFFPGTEGNTGASTPASPRSGGAEHRDTRVELDEDLPGKHYRGAGEPPDSLEPSPCGSAVTAASRSGSSLNALRAPDLTNWS